MTNRLKLVLVGKDVTDLETGIIKFIGRDAFLIEENSARGTRGENEKRRKRWEIRRAYLYVQRARNGMCIAARFAPA